MTGDGSAWGFVSSPDGDGIEGEEAGGEGVGVEGSRGRGIELAGGESTWGFVSSPGTTSGGAVGDRSSSETRSS